MGLRFLLPFPVFHLKACPAMALPSPARSEKAGTDASDNTEKSHTPGSWGRDPLPRNLAKSLPIPQGSWHKGCSGARALVSPSGSNSSCLMGRRSKLSFKRDGGQGAKAVCNPSAPCDPSTLRLRGGVNSPDDRLPEG